jgi:ABC-type Zn uptake system ZnuABC Zn-binding protein ZnuA
MGVGSTPSVFQSLADIKAPHEGKTKVAVLSEVLEIICKRLVFVAYRRHKVTMIRIWSACLACTLALPAAAAFARPASAAAPIRVVSSISTFDSLIAAVGGGAVEISNLVPIGSGPEDYQPTPSDVARLADAQVLFENGAGLETWLDRTIQNASNANLRLIVLSDGLPKKGYNPHLWMDPELARAYVGKIRDALCAADKAECPQFSGNAAAYEKKLVTLERWIAAQIATIPPAQRTMIVFHNAWQYYDDRFGLRTLGVVERSPGQEPSPDEIAALVSLARRYHVRAVFAEPEYSPKLVQALAESAGIKTVEDLYDDSLSQDAQAKDYITMLEYDTRVIVRSLGGHPR